MKVMCEDGVKVMYEFCARRWCVKVVREGDVLRCCEGYV